MYNAANNASSQLAQAIGASDTSLAVLDGSSFPEPPFVVSIEDEIIEVRAKNGNTFSALVRGTEGTTPASHASGSRVENRFTAGTYQQVVSELDAHKADGVHGKVEATSTDDATSIIDAPLKSAGGLAVAKRIVVGEGIVLNRPVDLPLPIPSRGSIIHYSFGLPDTDWTTVVDVGSNSWAMQLTGLIGGSDRTSERGFSLIYGRGGSGNANPYLILLRGSEEFIRLDGSALQFRSQWGGYGLNCFVFLSRIL